MTVCARSKFHSTDLGDLLRLSLRKRRKTLFVIPGRRAFFAMFFFSLTATAPSVARVRDHPSLARVRAHPSLARVRDYPPLLGLGIIPRWLGLGMITLC